MTEPGSQRLAGRVALVTGGWRGIGAVIAQRLAADGAKIVVNYVNNMAAADQVVAIIRAAGGEAEAIQVDVSRVAEATPLVAASVARFGRLDILVNNAAIADAALLDDIDEDLFDRHVATNVKSTLFLSQAAARVFDDRGGVIISVSSIGTRLAAPQFMVYGMTKAAIEMLTKTMARHLGPRRIRVNAVAPGSTDSAMLRRVLPPEALEERIALHPFGRLGQPEDIARVVAFLASDESGWITGETIHVNGGQIP